MIDLPPPPVPADCDLRSFPYLPLDVIRLRDSRLTATASGEEFRAAVLLWCASWHQVPASSLPTDDRELAQLAGYGRDMRGWSKVRAMALHGWVEHADGRLYHPVVAEKAAEAWRQRMKQQANANKRWGKCRADGAGTATAHATGHAMASPTAHANVMQQNRTEQKGIESAYADSSRADAGGDLASPDLPPRLREAYREIAQAEGGGPAGTALANRSLAAARRLFRVPTEAQLRETYRAAAEAGVTDQDPARWPDFRERMRRERAQERTGSTAGLDASRSEHFAQLDAVGAP